MLTGQKGCSAECRERSGLLGELLQMNPEAAKHSNGAGSFPLGFLLEAQKKSTGNQDLVMSMLEAYPPALFWCHDFHNSLFPHVTAQVHRHFDTTRCRNIIFELLRNRPELLSHNSQRETPSTEEK
jgi:hypothetical protein